MTSAPHGARRRLRVAAVGLGWVTTHRHLPAMRASRAFDLVGVVDRNGQRAREVASRLGGLRHAMADHLDAVDWLDGVDAITVGTAPMAHYRLISQALELGKHVLTEKPFAMTIAEGEALVADARDKGLTLGIVHNFQFSRSFKALLSELERGRLGGLRSIVATQLGNPRRRLPEWYEELPLGLFYDESPHMFYLIRRLAPGPLTLIKADTVPGPEGGTTPARIEIEYRCAPAALPPLPVTVRCNFASPISEWQLLVFGESRLGIVDLFRDIYISLPNDGAHQTWSVLRTSLSATWQHWWQHLPSGLGHLRGTLRYGNDEVFARFAAAALAGGQPADIGPEDALAVLKMQHQVVGDSRPLWS